MHEHYHTLEGTKEHSLGCELDSTGSEKVQVWDFVNTVMQLRVRMWEISRSFERPWLVLRCVKSQNLPESAYERSH